MPELPEVETSVRMLRPRLIGRRIRGMRCTWPRHIDRPEPEELALRIRDLTVADAYRRGKFLVFPLSQGETLIIHLRMTGHLAVVPAGEEPDPHTHTVFVLDHEEELRFRDPRKFGRVYLVNDTREVLGKLGMEPLGTDFTVAALAALLERRRRILKPLLLDQTVVAGIGNIYADEALFLAGLHPERRADTLTADEIARLHAAIQDVLRTGIAREGASITNYVNPDGRKGDMQNAVSVFRRTEQSCYRCGQLIRRIVVGGRSTHYCAHCQN